MRKIVLFIIVAVLVFSNSAFAAEIQDISKAITQFYVVDENIKNQVLEAYNKDIEGTNDKLQNEDYDIKKTDKVVIIKEYSLNTDDFIRSYFDGNTINSMILDRGIYSIPLKNINDNVIYRLDYKKGDGIIKNENIYSFENAQEIIDNIKSLKGKWYNCTTYPVMPSLGLLLYDSEKLQNYIIEQGIKNIEEIKLIELPFLYTSMIYINNSDGEYAIPFSWREDWTNVESGKLYKINDLFNILINTEYYNERLLNGTKSDDGELLSAGGIGSSDKALKDQDNTRCLYILVAVVIVLLGSIYIVLKKRNEAA